MGANTRLNGALASHRDIEDMPVLYGVEDKGFHAGVDDPSGVSHQDVDGRGGRDGALGFDAVLKM